MPDLHSRCTKWGSPSLDDRSKDGKRAAHDIRGYLAFCKIVIHISCSSVGERNCSRRKDGSSRSHEGGQAGIQCVDDFFRKSKLKVRSCLQHHYRSCSLFLSLDGLPSREERDFLPPPNGRVRKVHEWRTRLRLNGCLAPIRQMEKIRQGELL